MSIQALKKLSRRDRRVLTVGLVAAAVVALLHFVVLPIYDAQGGIESEVAGRERRLQQFVRMIQAREVYQAQLGESEQSLQQYMGRLLDATDSSTATVQLEGLVRDLAEEHSVQVSRSNPLRENKVGERYSKITLQVNLQGDLNQLTSFLYAVSTHSKFLQVENFIMNSFRAKNRVRIQPRMNISAFIRLS